MIKYMTVAMSLLISTSAQAHETIAFGLLGTMSHFFAHIVSGDPVALLSLAALSSLVGLLAIKFIKRGKSLAKKQSKADISFAKVK